MPQRPWNGKFSPLFLVVVTVAALVGGCSLSTPLCEEGDGLVAAAQPARALEAYARAKAQGDGCGDEGLDTASTNQRQAVEEAARGEAAERVGDIPAATAAYQAALSRDVTNALAVAGLARLDQPKPVPPPPVQRTERSWWAGPWPYFLASLLFSVLLAGAVLLFAKRKIAVLETQLKLLENKMNQFGKKVTTLDGKLIDIEERQQSEYARLDGLQKHHKQRIDQLAELIDLSAQIQAEPTSEVILWLKPLSVKGKSAGEVISDSDGTNGTEDDAIVDNAISVDDRRVELNVFAIRIGHGQEVREQLVVQRVIERVATRDVGRTDLSDRPEREAEPGPVEKAAADRVVEPVWERVEQSWWVTPDYRGLADCAKCVSDVANGWHNLVLGEPAKRIALGAGFSPASADVMGMIAEKVSLPGDGIFKSVRRLFQYTGIALGVVSGAAPLANACISLLAHDLLAEATSKAFRSAFDHVFAPERSEVRSIPVTELGPDGARTRQLHKDLVAEIQCQRARERQAHERAQREREPRERWLGLEPRQRWLELEQRQLEARWPEGPSIGL